MLLRHALAAPHSALVGAERYINAGSPSGFSGQYTVSQRYHPRLGDATFTVPLYAARAPLCGRIVESSWLSPELSVDVERLIGPLLPLHPDVLKMDKNATWLAGLEHRGELRVTPTASGRTVIVDDDATCRFHIKLHYNSILGRYDRSLTRRKALASLDVNDLLHEALSYWTTLRRPCPLAFLPEARIQCVDGPGLEQGACAVIRGSIPVPAVTADPILLPAFSLFSVDERAPDDRLLIDQILDGYRSRVAALLEHLLLPLIDGFLALALDLGVIPEINAQNVLVELGPDGRVLRLVYRDLQGSYKDQCFLGDRRSAGLRSRYKTLVETTPRDFENTRKQRSYLFDFKLGTYVLAPLIKSCAGAAANDVIAVIRDHVAREFLLRGVERREYFPGDQTWYAQTPAIYERGRPFYEVRRDPLFR